MSQSTLFLIKKMNFGHDKRKWSTSDYFNFQPLILFHNRFILKKKVRVRLCHSHHNRAAAIQLKLHIFQVLTKLTTNSCFKPIFVCFCRSRTHCVGKPQFFLLLLLLLLVLLLFAGLFDVNWFQSWDNVVFSLQCSKNTRTPNLFNWHWWR